jgi:CRISPR/Cas system-associated exonuclease Cas4 (RecB family)
VPLYLEQQFHLKLGEYMFKGVIDRIDSVGRMASGEWQAANSSSIDTISNEPLATSQEVELIDYKTGQMPKNGKLGPDDKEQLMIYDLACREVMKLKPVQLSYYYLEAGKKLSFSADESEVQKIKDSLIEKIKGIRSSDFQPTPGFWCGSCDFRDICEDRWRG